MPSWHLSSLEAKGEFPIKIRREFYLVTDTDPVADPVSEPDKFSMRLNLERLNDLTKSRFKSFVR